jgi:hypothetical protein
VVLDGVVLSILAVLAGLFVGLVRHGRLRNVARVRVRWPWLLGAGIAVPAVVDRFDLPGGVPLVVAALGTLLLFTLRNLPVVGMGVVAVGVSCNLLAVVSNGGMPVRADALVQAGLARRDEIARVEIRGAQRLERPGDRLTLLGDRVPVAETGQVLSFGDLVILVGLADVAANLTRRRRRAARPLPRNAGPALVSIAPPAERVDTEAVIDLRRLEAVVTTGYAGPSDEEPPGPPVRRGAVSVTGPGAATAEREGRSRRSGERNIPDFEAIVLADDLSRR